MASGGIGCFPFCRANPLHVTEIYFVLTVCTCKLPSHLKVSWNLFCRFQLFLQVFSWNLFCRILLKMFSSPFIRISTSICYLPVAATKSNATLWTISKRLYSLTAQTLAGCSKSALYVGFHCKYFPVLIITWILSHCNTVSQPVEAGRQAGRQESCH